MGICELSFRSTHPCGSLPFYVHQIDLLRAVPPSDLPRELGRLANHLRRETGQAVLAGGAGRLLSASPLSTCEAFQVLTMEAIDLVDSDNNAFLKQVINRSLVQYFENRDLKVNAYEREAFSKKPTVLSGDIEAQRYLRWNLRIDEQKYVFLSIDYSNEYHDRLNLYDRGTEFIAFDQPLVHIYDSKACRFVSLADFTVSTPLTALGNISLLEYHRRQGTVSSTLLDAIPPDTKAVQVNYGSLGKDVIYAHIPQLLRKSFTRDDVDTKQFNERVWPIDKRFEQAIKAVAQLNQAGGLSVVGQAITFDPKPYSPPFQISFVQHTKNIGYGQNLDFGNGVFGGYPAQGLQHKQLLEKPSQIQAVVFHPQGENIQAWGQALIRYFDGFAIKLVLHEYRSYPVDNVLGIQRECRQLEGFNLALMCVPDQEHYRNRTAADPYPVLKREFIQRGIPSQGIELSTIRDRHRSSNDNILLGVLGKLGYSPWQLRQMPGTAQAFMGLDVGRKDGRAVGASTFVVNRLGRVIGWSATDFQSHRETFDSDALRRAVFGLINLFEEQEESPLTHLVIHRDGMLQADEFRLLEELMPALQDAGVQEVDIVEILKSGYDRAGQWNDSTQCWENPQRGWAWSYSETEAAVMTTGAREIRGSKNFVPRPLTLRRRFGNTQIGILASQVYWLSEMHIGSTQTVRLPITTYYSDAAATYALEGLLPTGIQIARSLPFL